MSIVYTGASMSLDGYISGPGETGFDYLFRWYGNGDVVVSTAQPELNMSMSEVSAQYFRRTLEETGALVVGRHLFDFTNGWDGTHPMGLPVVVLTHNPPAEWTEGIEAAVEAARQLAGDKNVGVNGGIIAQQCLDTGLLDEVFIDLVPVLLGGGTPFFPGLGTAPVELEGPVSVVEGTEVTHLHYRVRRS